MAIKNFNGFFSEYFLTQVLESEFKGKIGADTRKDGFNILSKLWNKVRDRYGRNSPIKEYKNTWIKPLFKELGFRISEDYRADVVIDSDDSEIEYKVDYVLEDSSKNICAISIIPWDTDCEKIPKTSNYSYQVYYLEINFEELFQLFNEDFNTFWAIMSKDAFIEADGKTLLAEVQEKSEKFAVQIGDELRGGVREVIEKFIVGIVEDEENKGIIDYDTELKELYENALKFMYRLLFVLYAEARDLLPIDNPIYASGYSIEYLKDDLIGRKFNRNSKYTLWYRLKALFNLIWTGLDTTDLVITAFRGNLFAETYTPIINNIKVNDSTISEILKIL